ncbi:stage II sporulation protein R [Bacillus horti]|uniref:Stage II sporulation protein R n=2 Tax=Caldalkalibacillus horti TaxID=77523 RepID=A0ABT9VW72_9BACI|nr:stage II sporulation protein R [Bacillus horti]
MKVDRVIDRGRNVEKKKSRLALFLAISLLVIVMSWEYQSYASASMLNQTVGIPEESIRLRVLAHSDSPSDQWLKREVRDAIVDQINEWVGDIQDIEQARAYIQAAEVELNQLVRQTIQERGYSYSSSIQFGEVVFPAKLYGNQLYPAGEYEGLLVTIGAGQGENWWCVLFPPLCFIDFGTGQTVAENQDSNDSNQSAFDNQQEQEVEVRFFVLEWLSKIKSWFS